MSADTLQLVLVLALLVGVIVAFGFERVPAEIIALTTPALLPALGLITTEDAVGALAKAAPCSPSPACSC